jgi:hypothetical protein
LQILRRSCKAVSGVITTDGLRDERNDVRLRAKIKAQGYNDLLAKRFQMQKLRWVSSSVVEAKGVPNGQVHQRLGVA